ncbi:hypothetical protein ANTRET_LOCUS4258 [Anthophora retusa]
MAEASSSVAYPEESSVFAYESCKPTKQELTDAVQCFVNILREQEIINDNASDVFTPRVKIVANKLYNYFCEMDDTFCFLDSDELHEEYEMPDDTDSSTVVAEVETSTSSSPSSKGSAPYDVTISPPEKRGKFQAATLEEKIRIVALAEKHPKWNLKSLKSKGGFHLKRKDQVAIWKEEILSGGTKYDKFRHIDKWTYTRFAEARQAYAPVSTRTLQEWAIAAAMPYISDTFRFSASRSWLINFKRKHYIRQRQVTRYVSRRKMTTLQEIEESAKRFQHQTKNIITAGTIPPHFIINTDQTGCEYRTSIKRSLSHKGEKATQIAIDSISKMTHSYTAQYSITLAGKLIPKVLTF